MRSKILAVTRTRIFFVARFRARLVDVEEYASFS